MALPLATCLLLVAAITVLTPDPATDFRRSYLDVGIGEQARLRQFDLTVTQVRLARSVQRRTDEAFTTGHVLVVVGVEGVARSQVTFFRNVALLTRDDRRYQPRPELGLAGMSLTQPGFSRTGVLVFEVPRERVPRAELLVDPDVGEFDAYDLAARVDLGLDIDTAVTGGQIMLQDSIVEVAR